ncbi:membrane-associated protein, putative [Bodo saltans]|uniref:Membrane-associated protein, putative n=1 Tax=Bodo saltans TaxID=75058 RepID=A0A0S4JNL6_BODSA|nr:membrane-associated protein, putative [Bodo saltans]|eukprot:CUG91726.1 membrane-associated protein, putative [Bodo saltans]
MRRATFLSTLFVSLLVVVLLQIFTMSSSPGFHEDSGNALNKGGRYSTVMPAPLATVPRRPLNAQVLTPQAAPTTSHTRRVVLPLPDQQATLTISVEQGNTPSPSVASVEATQPDTPAPAALTEQLSSPTDAPSSPLPMATPIASFGLNNLSKASIALVGRVVQRREDIERRQREQIEHASTQTKWSRYLKGVAKKVVGVSIVEEGNVEPSEEVAESLKLRTVFHHFNDQEDLLARYRYMDIVYTWVNGSEHNHMFRKYYRRHAVRKEYIPLEDEDEGVQRTTAEEEATTATAAATNGTNVDNKLLRLRKRGNAGRLPLLPPADAIAPVNRTWMRENRMRWVPGEPNQQLGGLSGLLRFLDSNRNRFISSRDRESDELRYSMRSLDQFVDWHHGRIIVVAPGHCPLWLDHSSNFFARSQRPIGHVRRRVVAVHQDTIIPGNQRLTFNTNGIEQHVHKLQNLSNLFVQFNDDYFVNHQTSVSDFVNKYGGPNQLHEGGEVKGAGLAFRQIKKIWLGGVYHSNSFIIRELEEVSPRYVPKYVAAKVAARVTAVPLTTTADGGYGGCSCSCRGQHHQSTIEATTAAPNDDVAPTTTAVETIGGDVAEAVPTTVRQLLEAQVSTQRRRVAGRPIARVLDEQGREVHEQRAKRKRYFLKHAPFVYCRRMFEYLAERHEREFTEPAVANQHRHKADLLMPFIHNAFTIDRPWAGSPNYLPHVLSVTSPNASQNHSLLTVHLDNADGCAPAVGKIGEAAKSLLVIFIDDMKENEKRIEKLAEVNPVFFALNDGFSRPEPQTPPHSCVHLWPASTQTVVSLKSKSSRLSPQRDDKAVHGDEVSEGFEALMKLPIVVLVNGGEATLACPLLRSLRLALPRHTGSVVIAQDPQDSDVSLDDANVLRDEAPRLVTKCRWNPSRVEELAVEPGRRRDRDDPRRVLEAVRSKSTVFANASSQATLRRVDIDLLPSHYQEVVDRIGGLVFDMRRTDAEGPFFTSAIGQTLALEDFVLLPPKDTTRSLRWLYLSAGQARHHRARSLEAAAAQASSDKAIDDILFWPVNWIKGLSVAHLLYTFPLPYAPYELTDRIMYSFQGEDSW